MATKQKQAKMTWSPDEPGTIWGFHYGTGAGIVATYFIKSLSTDQHSASVCHPYTPKRKVCLGVFKTQEEAKAACAVDALKYL